MENLLLKCQLSPGDVVMLTAAVRDLHRAHPDRFRTVVKTSAPALWDYNPNVKLFRGDATEYREIDCHYPLVHHSNRRPFHFIHGYMQDLAAKLEVPIVPTDFHGDIHLSSEERGLKSQVAEVTGSDEPFWIVTAGGKYDFTIKWWSHQRFQEVVDYFQGKIRFVQIGEKHHNHPLLKGVIDLRGKTDHRQLVRLVYHAQGVLCPVTFPMHLAAATPTKSNMPKNRPCVVVAGGREPVHWEAYPGHRFLHTQGALPCCDTGGCWRSRTLPLGDDERKDRADQLCVRVEPNGLPKCMDMITTRDVTRAIESYFEGGMIDYLKNESVSVSPHEEKFSPEVVTPNAPSRDKQFFEVFGLRRSGLHVIMNWVISHYEGTVTFVNDLNNQRRSFDKYPKCDGLPCLKAGNFTMVPPSTKSLADLLVVSYEDMEFEGIHGCGVPNHIAKNYEYRKILILRDPFNHFASRLRASRRYTGGFANGLVRKCDDGEFRFVKLWKEMAREFIAERGNSEFPDALKVNYNRWVDDVEYRKSLSRDLGKPFFDNAKEQVPGYGYGSSFDRMQFDKKGSEMSVFERWKEFQFDGEYISLFDPEILEMSDRVFGTIASDLRRRIEVRLNLR